MKVHKIHPNEWSRLAKDGFNIHTQRFIMMIYIYI